MRSKRLVVAWFSAVFAIAIIGLPMSIGKGMSDDFLVYVSELDCVVRGVDPYDVWTGRVESDKFYPYDKKEQKTETRTMPIHGHTPWFYTYFLPFSGDWPITSKWIVWELCQIPFFLIIVAVCYSIGRRLPGDDMANSRHKGLFVAAAALSVGFTFPLRFIGNNLLVAAAGIALMLHCLVKGRDILAGVCWAIAIIKPQDGLLLAIPLLFAKKWKTVLVGGLVCLVASALASCLIGKPIVDLLLEVPKLKPVNVSAALIPDLISERLVDAGIGKETLAFASMMIGVSLCVALTWLVRKSDDWLARMLPAVMCASIWTYMDSCDRCIFFVAQALFACRYLTAKSAKERFWMATMMVIVFCTGLQPILYCGGIISAMERSLGCCDLTRICMSIVNPIDAAARILFAVGVLAFCIQEYRLHWLEK